MNEQQNILKTYKVCVGLVEVNVKARDVQEAVILARRKLSQELPRLYDVIRSLSPGHFQVDHAA